MTSLNSKLQLALLNRKKGRNLVEKGFTLVELMIVIVIVGILSAVALPNFLGTKDKAEAGAQIGSIVGLAKQCSLNAIQESVDNIPGTVTTATAANGQEILLAASNSGTNCSKGATMKNTVAYTPEKIKGMKCGAVPTTSGDVIEANGLAPDAGGHTICTITVDADGAITGAWS